MALSPENYQDWLDGIPGADPEDPIHDRGYMSKDKNTDVSAKELCGDGWFDPSKCDTIAHPTDHGETVYITPKGNYIHTKVSGYYERWDRAALIKWVFRNGVQLSAAQRELIFPPESEL